MSKAVPVKDNAKRDTRFSIAQATYEIVNNPYLPTPCKVMEFFRESGDNFTITIESSMDPQPGQFVQVSLPGIGECPISIASHNQEHIKLNIRQVGNMTNALAKLRTGDTLFIRGPYGNSYPMEQLVGNNLVFIGGGCGVAPLKGIVDYVENHREAYKDIHLIFGFRSPDDILFRRESTLWRKQYHMVVSVDKDPHQGDNTSCYTGPVGFVTEVLKTQRIAPTNTVVFVCGPPIMMKFVIQILKDKGFHDDQIFISAERLMYCAIGKCCHCMIRGKFTCMDGPVFRYDQVANDTND